MGFPEGLRDPCTDWQFQCPHRCRIDGSRPAGCRRRGVAGTASSDAGPAPRRRLLPAGNARDGCDKEQGEVRRVDAGAIAQTCLADNACLHGDWPMELPLVLPWAPHIPFLDCVLSSNPGVPNVISPGIRQRDVSARADTTLCLGIYSSMLLRVQIYQFYCIFDNAHVNVIRIICTG